MLCSTGWQHTITVSETGTVYSFGSNHFGQIGYEDDAEVRVPKSIAALQKITKVSCGGYFTTCLDEEGCLWSFGANTYGQLGIGSKIKSKIPQKIKDIPAVIDISCGGEHVLIITIDSNLWACGLNEYGQLGLEREETIEESPKYPFASSYASMKYYCLNFKKTSFSNVSKISAGYDHSLFQIDEKIFACGSNSTGELGLGHNSNQIGPCVINAPLNIMDITCGCHHSLFLDTEGNVYSVGSNDFGQLGINNTNNQNTLHQIENIPPIKYISSAGDSSYLLDFDGMLWSFGRNNYSQLGHGTYDKEVVPKKVNSLKDIQQISSGSSSSFVLVKDSKNKIFVTGANVHGQLGIGGAYTRTNKLEQIDPMYYKIWGNLKQKYKKAKSARK